MVDEKMYYLIFEEVEEVEEGEDMNSYWVVVEMGRHYWVDHYFV